MKICKKIVIVGLGLIGGSLGIVLKQKRIAQEIVGVSRKDSTLREARRRKSVDWCTKDLKKAVGNADIIVLAAPVNTIIGFAEKLANSAPKKCIITDVGSTKEKIVRAFESRCLNFVGAHPLAGSEKRGVHFAQGNLFQDSVCILTPTKNTSRGSLLKIKRLWQAAGARTLALAPEKHDAVLSLVSHLPHIIAFSLVDILPTGWKKFVPSSFRDVTRIAASDAQLWQEIFLTNRKSLAGNIDKFIRALQQFKAMIQKQDSPRLYQSLKRISVKRNRL
jgi:prephenate dehydrogenase